MSWPKSSYRATTCLWPRKCKHTSLPTYPPLKSKTPMATVFAQECALCSTSSPSTKPPPTSGSHCKEVLSLRGTKHPNEANGALANLSLRGTNVIARNEAIQKTILNSKLLNPIFTIFKNPILDTQIENELQHFAPKRIKPSDWHSSISINRNELSGKP